jgi:hypothetical protein
MNHLYAALWMLLAGVPLAAGALLAAVLLATRNFNRRRERHD